MRKQLLAAAVATLAISGTAVAHEPGDVILRVGAARVSPVDSSTKISTGVTGKIPGTKAGVNGNNQVGLTGTYIVAPHLGIEVLAATPFTHKVNVKGIPNVGGVPYSLANGKFADVKHLPPTISAQYFFLDPKSKFQPYAGVGLNYTWFFDEQLTKHQKSLGFSKLKLSNSFGLAAQLGADVALTDNLFLNAAVWKIDINTKARATHNDIPGNPGTALGRVKVDVDVDPWVYFVGVGYKF
ncbi:outer membrane protein W [Betaproteobacteria bacterium]|nr:outer membrane protein W [Betaproteobacteria bacterium]GHU01134.1 outer membrane protein W [Betaproteobacteria bacterium]GHU17947.1 outer membrane protein W [Betaproteobacteria bacterium]